MDISDTLIFFIFVRVFFQGFHLYFVAGLFGKISQKTAVAAVEFPAFPARKIVFDFTSFII